jgi:polysaccharide deacetylase family protein (PEP-CTERM system associated)
VKSIFSVDVEDWFHILDFPTAPDISEWNSLPSCVERNFTKLLDIFSAKDVKVTCFFLGYIAERYPHLVREAHRRGHEIASHGYSHRLIYSMTQETFLEDVRRSKNILENITGEPVSGYRGPGFSVTKDTPWFFDTILKAGYRYDSSVFPAPRQHGGLETGHYAPYLISNQLMEFPITVTSVMGQRMCFFGGGYLRLFPYTVIRQMCRKVLAENRPVVFYIHPREIDPAHPRLNLSRARAFKSYVNLDSTEPKIKKILDDFQVTSFADFIAENPSMFIEKDDSKHLSKPVSKSKTVSEAA